MSREEGGVRLNAGGSLLESVARKSTVFVAGAGTTNDRRAHAILWVCFYNGEGGRCAASPLPCRYIVVATTGFFAVLRLAALRTVFFATFFADFLAAAFFVVLRTAALRTDFFATFFAGFLAAAFLTFLAIVISSFGLSLRLVGRELFDSPMIFLKQFGLQVVSASHRAHFSACSVFLFAMTA